MDPTLTVDSPWYQGSAFRLLVILQAVYLVGAFVGTDGLGAHAISLLTIVAVLLSPGPKATIHPGTTPLSANVC